MIRTLTLDDVVEATGGALVDGPQSLGASGEELVTVVSTDTRTLAPGALFVALKGEKHDGHDHVNAAVSAGATALVVERPLHESTLPHVVVVDTLRALGDIARFIRDAFAGPVVGVTGSVGKTTTKELIAHTLAHAGGRRVQKSAANHNNEIGVPQTIFGLDERDDTLVLEMGMRGTGQIARLCQIGAPTIGVVTGVGWSHAELLGSRAAIAGAKGELLAQLPRDGLAVLPANDPFIDLLRERFAGPTITCAVEGEASVIATGLVRHENGWRFTVDSPWGRTKLFLPSPGRFNVLNALFAVAVAGHLGVELTTVARSLARWKAPSMRLETITTPQGTTILSDAYNAAPESMIGALEALGDTPVGGGGRRIAVLGEMRELGDLSAEGHAAVGRAAAQTAPDLLLLVGPLTVDIAGAARAAGFPAERIRVFATTEPVIDELPSLVGPSDVVLVKGSRALALERVVEALAA